jgi:hypothetical protein
MSLAHLTAAVAVRIHRITYSIIRFDLLQIESVSDVTAAVTGCVAGRAEFDPELGRALSSLAALDKPQGPRGHPSRRPRRSGMSARGSAVPDNAAVGPADPDIIMEALETLEECLGGDDQGLEAAEGPTQGLGEVGMGDIGPPGDGDGPDGGDDSTAINEDDRNEWLEAHDPLPQFDFRSGTVSWPGDRRPLGTCKIIERDGGDMCTVYCYMHQCSKIMTAASCPDTAEIRRWFARGCELPRGKHSQQQHKALWPKGTGSG